MKVHKLWNEYMKAYDFLLSVSSYNEYLNNLACRLGEVSGRDVLDAGSGTGNLSIVLKKRGASVLSCDFSPAALEIHREKDPTAIQLLASLEDSLPRGDATMDAVCCASVLFALSKHGCARALSEFFRLLRPRGKVIVSVPAHWQRNGKLIDLYLGGLIEKYGPIEGRVRAMRGSVRLVRVLYYTWRISRLPDWSGFHRFQADELKGFLQSSGFEQVQIETTYGGYFFVGQGIKPN